MEWENFTAVEKTYPGVVGSTMMVILFYMLMVFPHVDFPVSTCCREMWLNSEVSLWLG